jgi:transcriptional regulator with XRE-family HTH domain
VILFSIKFVASKLLYCIKFVSSRGKYGISRFFSERLRELRKEQGETQQQVADGLGVPRQHYHKFEAGENLPSLERFIALADHFGVSLDYLAGRTEERGRP